MRRKFGIGSLSSGSRYKVTARCGPEIDINSTTDENKYANPKVCDSRHSSIAYKNNNNNNCKNNKISENSNRYRHRQPNVNISYSLSNISEDNYGNLSQDNFGNISKDNFGKVSNSFSNIIPSNIGDSKQNDKTSFAQIPTTTVATPESTTALGSTSSKRTSPPYSNTSDSNYYEPNCILHNQHQQNQHQQKQQQHQSKKATLVEEEDFNELTAVPNTALAIAVTTATKDKANKQPQFRIKVNPNYTPLNLGTPVTTAGILEKSEFLDSVRAAGHSIITEADRNAATITAYSQNSKTTRSWPVIYRNSHYYDNYEINAPSTTYPNPNSNPNPIHNPNPNPTTTNNNNLKSNFHQYAAPATAVSFKQNCYSNHFKQSIVYPSSNEDLTTINEYTADGGGCSNDYGYIGNGAASTLGQNINSAGVGNTTTTTCYYFAPNHHNSIYDHPSALVGGGGSSLQYESHCASATAAAIEAGRRSNSILLRNSSLTSKIMQSSSTGIGGIDSTSSITANIHDNDQTLTSACCSNCCIGPPPVLFLFVTLLMTTSATAMLCAAIMTDHWEHVMWDRESVDKYTNRSGLQLDWILDEKIGMLKPDRTADYRFRRDTLFLVPMHGGIWTLCIDLPLEELQELRRHRKFPPSAPTCLNYLAGSTENVRGEEQRNDWQHSESLRQLPTHLRMQNLSISCSLVCLIILGSAALVGAFGVCQRQISAILITGVMYLLAALFALFTLMIIHFKRQQGRPLLDSDYDGTVDGIVARPGGAAIIAKPLLGARVFLTSWSLDLGWGGVVLCAIASVLWILLSKIMRYNPFSTLMI